jgi:aconitate hydratase
MGDSFQCKGVMQVGAERYSIFRLPELAKRFPAVRQLPYSIQILLEMLLRTEDGATVRAADIEAVAQWDPKAEPAREIAFTPSRVLMQDFTGVPAVVDLAAMRDAMKAMQGDPGKINPLQPAELVIDHSVQVDAFGSADAILRNTELEYARNRERYAFLRWGQKALANFQVVPPETGICHQVNLEYLAHVAFTAQRDGEKWVYPDTVVGTDSHTTMINGLGVLGWGVGGIEAEAAMLGQPMSMLLPQVVGFRLFGKLKEGSTATDLVLTVTEMLRKRGVVGKFVEFFGEGVAALPVADRATISNMAPEYGATCGLFPVDEETLTYLRLSGRPKAQVALVEAYFKEQGLFHAAATPAATYSDVLELDLTKVEACVAGPSRPQDRVPLGQASASFTAALPNLLSAAKPKKKALPLEVGGGAAAVAPPAATAKVDHGSVVIAAITSCTNTSNPSVMLGAGVLAKKAVEHGLATRPAVKTSLAPGSKVVTEYLRQSGLQPYLDKLGFNVVGYGCTTCIGNSGPLAPEVSRQIEEGGLVVGSVLSGNRNFEGRVHPEVRANYLMSPPLVVAYALAGRIDLNLLTEPLGTDKTGKPVFLRDIWPTHEEIRATMRDSVSAEMFARQYASVYQGDARWQALPVPAGEQYAWDAKSTYVKRAPYFDDMPRTPAAVKDPRGLRVLAVLGDSITTDHISPAGSIKADSPAGKYLIAHGVQPADFNSYGARRGNHEVMVRGTFANVRLKNKLVPGTEGGFTRHLPDGQPMTIFDASEKYRGEGVPLLVLAGKEYGSGSSRDWAAKGPMLLGVRVVIAESYERIHRSNLVGMGILPLQFLPGETAASLSLSGEEVYDVEGLAAGMANSFASGRQIAVKAKKPDGTAVTFKALVRIDTPRELQYYQHGGILQYVLRQLLAAK